MKETDSGWKIYTNLIVFASISFIALNFQNCSGVSSTDLGSEGETGSGGVVGIRENPQSPTVDPEERRIISSEITAEFDNGEAFTGQTLVDEDSFIDTLIKNYNYVSHSNAKAVALSLNGLGYASMIASDDIDDAERVAMEACNLISGTDCALVISQNNFVVDHEEVKNNLDYALQNSSGEAFDRNKIPVSSQIIRDSQLVSDYINAQNNKAMALSMTGGVFVTYTQTFSLGSTEVQRMALQQCELESALSPCVLYAFNEEVVFDPTSWIKKSNINYDNNDVLGVAPPAARDGALSSVDELLDETAREIKYSIFITPNGYGYFGTADTKEEASQKASQSCESGSHGSRCIEYATSAGVLLSPDDLKSKSSFGDLFCKTPRQSCFMHLQLGCPEGGEYWVQDTRTLVSEASVCGN